jgi:predicted nucleic acid-binding protein
LPAAALVDTSVLYAFLDRGEPWHEASKTAIAEAPLPLVTTAAVLTELFHFALRRMNDQKGVWRLLRTRQIEISPISTADLPALESLMLRYADRPMDFADATLVHVAEREGLKTILTIDHDDFETYRIGRNAKFRILPARAR